MKKQLLSRQQLFWLFVTRQTVSFGILVWLTMITRALPDPRLFYAMVISCVFFALFALTVIVKAVQQNRKKSS